MHGNLSLEQIVWPVQDILTCQAFKHIAKYNFQYVMNSIVGPKAEKDLPKECLIYRPWKLKLPTIILLILMLRNSLGGWLLSLLRDLLTLGIA